MSSLLLSLDLGTTHSKTGLFPATGRLFKYDSRKMVLHHDPPLSSYFDPDELWKAAVEIILEISAG